MRGSIAFGLVVLGTLVVFACGDDEAGSTPRGPSSDDDGDDAATDAPVTPAVGGAEAMARAYCVFQERCRESAYRSLYADQAQCVAALVANNNLIVLAPGDAIDVQMGGCATKMEGASCETAFNAIPECDFHGTLPDGTACFDARLCTNGGCTYTGTPATRPKCGVCSTAVPLNGDCMNNYCASSLVAEYAFDANGTTTACTCRRQPTEGQACIGGGCSGLLQCVNDKCTKPLQKGANCDATADACFRERDLVCTNGVCAEAARTNLGGDCTTSMLCTDGAQCLDGTCVARAALGEACSGANEPACRLDFSCLPPDGGATNVCVPRTPTRCD